MKLELVRDFVVREFLSGEQPEALATDQPLISSGLIDSVGTLRLVLFLEEAFKIRVEPEDISAGKLDTLSSIAALVEEKRTCSEAPPNA